MEEKSIQILLYMILHAIIKVNSLKISYELNSAQKLFQLCRNSKCKVLTKKTQSKTRHTKQKQIQKTCFGFNLEIEMEQNFKVKF